MSIPSKPIPIPRREDDHSPNDDSLIMSPREATEVYDAATWRMFELITSARLRAARNYHYKVLVEDDYPSSSSRHVVMTHHHIDHNGALAGGKMSSSQLQQLDDTHHRDRVFSLPEPSSAPPPTSSLMDEVFPMDSL